MVLVLIGSTHKPNKNQNLLTVRSISQKFTPANALSNRSNRKLSLVSIVQLIVRLVQIDQTVLGWDFQPLKLIFLLSFLHPSTLNLHINLDLLSTPQLSSHSHIKLLLILHSIHSHKQSILKFMETTQKIQINGTSTIININHKQIFILASLEAN